VLPGRALIHETPRWAWAAALILVCCLPVGGCSSGGKLAPVSGTVTLDGKPLADALIVFQPIANAGKPAPGMGSSGVTDASGKYTLRTMDTDRPGAVVAKHSVAINMKGESSDLDKPGPPKKGLPAKYNRNSELQFDVQPGGTDKADFDILSK
jgi:hypothetical protein